MPNLDDLQTFYRSHLKDRLGEIDAGIKHLDDGDCEPLRRVSHSLKGSGLTYGHAKITEAAAHVEAAAARNEIDRLPQLVEDLRRIVRAIAGAD